MIILIKLSIKKVRTLKLNKNIELLFKNKNKTKIVVKKVKN